MSQYSLEKIGELIFLDADDKGYIELADISLFLLKRPDSLLSQAIMRSKRNPNHLKEFILEFRPTTRSLKDKKPAYTKHLNHKITAWQNENIINEEDVTRALIEEPGVLSYALVVLKFPIATIIENLSVSMYEGPDRINTQALNMGKNLTALAKRDELMPCIGRENEVKKIVSILLRMTKNFPVLIGEAGVGKTAIVEGLAQYLISDEVPAKLKNCTIIDFPVSLFTAGHKYSGETEKFTQKVIDELRRNKDVILFLDEIHQLIGAGTTENNDSDVAQLFKPILARGEIKVIGATTLAEYKILEKDAAFERRMNPVKVEEPSIEDTIAMLEASRGRYEKHYGLAVDKGIIRGIVKLSSDYLTHRKLPDKAFDLLDYSMARLSTFSEGKDLRQEDILSALVDLTGVDIANLERPVENKLSALEAKIKHDVIGQDQAISKLMNKVKLAYGGLMRREKPLGVFLFLGSSGIGKTHLAKKVAQHLFGDERRFLRIDMGEYTEANTVNRLIGSPPGYKGMDDGGVLTEYIKNNPFSIILFDEIEKAHYQIADVFLSLFGEGRITDGRGRTMDARNIICIMTSNHGVEQLTRHIFTGEMDDEEQEERLKANLVKAFRPELLNRLDEVIVFRKLDEEDMQKICQLTIEKIKQRLTELEIRLEVSKEVVDLLSEKALEIGGARYLERQVEDGLLLPISEMRLTGKLKPGNTIKVNVKKEKLEFELEGLE